MNQTDPQDSRKSVLSTGISTLVLIFVLLCLLTFSVLSLVSANTNKKLSQKSADRTTAYYQAENLANDILIRIIHCMDRHSDASDEKDFLSAIYAELQNSSDLVFEDDRTLSWKIPISEDQYLNVEIILSFQPFPDGKNYRITSWNTETDYHWGTDEALPLPEENCFPEFTEESL